MDHAFQLSRTALIDGTPEKVFALLDDPTRLGRHMAQPSAMMLGGQMQYLLGPEQDRALGARIDIRGSFLGLRLWADQVVVARDPPERKVWKTLPGEHLLAIGPYQLGFEMTSVDAKHVNLRVFIDYDLPSGWMGRILGTIFGGLYARWCVTSILHDAGT